MTYQAFRIAADDGAMTYQPSNRQHVADAAADEFALLAPSIGIEADVVGEKHHYHLDGAAGKYAHRARGRITSFVTDFALLLNTPQIGIVCGAKIEIVEAARGRMQ
jgi:hypothetical protein